MALLVVQFRFLTLHGQTIGKKVLGIRTNVLMRTVLNWFMGSVSLYAVVDIFFIFRDEQRCVHEYIAGTRVVVA